MSFLIAPSLLSSDFSKLGEEIKALERAGANWIHWDIMDSHFVPDLTFGPAILKSVRELSRLTFDVHLMVEKPEQFLRPFVKAGADIITFHLEAEKKPLSLIKEIKNLGLKAGLSIKPKTDLEKIYPFLEHLDLVLIMTVEPGKGGQSFLSSQAKKVALLKEKISSLNSPPLIEVDGGINPETAKQVSSADVLVSGSYLFKGNYKERITKLKTAHPWGVTH